jgi:hypothetical protein
MYKVYFSKKNCKKRLALPTKHGFNPPPWVSIPVYSWFNASRPSLFWQGAKFSGTKNDIQDKKRYPGQKALSGTISFLCPAAFYPIKIQAYCDKHVYRRFSFRNLYEFLTVESNFNTSCMCRSLGEVWGRPDTWNLRR